MERQPKKMKKYCFESLIKYCKNNNIELTKNYTNEQISQKTRIEGNCLGENCETNFEKNFECLIKLGGYCKSCSSKIRVGKRAEMTKNKNFKMLEEFCSKNNIILANDYSKEIIRYESTMIEGKCKVENCNEKFKKTFKYLETIGPVCLECSKNISKNKVRISKSHQNVFSWERLQDFCNKENIELTKEYQKNYVSIETMIEGKCKSTNCTKNFNKFFKQLINSGGFCKSCTSKIAGEKYINTVTEKYGCTSVMMIESIKEKARQTNLKRYGTSCVMRNENVKKKYIESCIKNFGQRSPLQNPEISEKMMKSCFTTKNYTFPSGKMIKVQGYEPFGINELINIEKISEDDIITNRSEVPTIWYKDINEKKHRYFVDIYIPSQKRCIEVKSTWTFQKNNVFEKQQAMKDAGYECEIWVFDRKGKKVERYN